MANSNHIRNVRGMHAAPRCQATTTAENRCQKPALKGQPFCETHSKSDVNRKETARSEPRSVRETRWRLEAEVRQIEKDIRRRRRNGASREDIQSLEDQRRELQRVAELKADELLAHYGGGNQDAVEVPSRPTVVARPLIIEPDEALRTLNLDRARGAMLGLAIGEALGVTTTGFDRGFPEKMDMYGAGRLGLKRGEWAADTAAMLALAESVSATPSFDERDYIERLVDGFDNGTYSCTGTFVGAENSTLVAIHNYKAHGRIPACDPSVPRPSNGFLARIAPVAVRFWNQEIKRHDVARRQSRLTHAGYALEDLSQTWVDMLAQSIEFGNRPMVLTNRIIDKRLGECVTYGMLRNLPEGWVESGEDAEKSLAAAAWCVAKGDGFRDSALKAMNLGGDACSIAAMTCQLAGAIYGARAIPPEWLEELAWGDRILAAADVLFEQSLPGLCTHGCQ